MSLSYLSSPDDQIRVTGNYCIYCEDEHEHLQVDVICLYLIFLVQMIKSGLQVIVVYIVRMNMNIYRLM